MIDGGKLMGALLIGSGKSSSSQEQILSNLRYKDLRNVLVTGENLNTAGRGELLYGRGKRLIKGKKRSLSNDVNDAEEQELATQAKHAKLFEYYNTYKEHEQERLHAMLKVDNPLKKMNQTDYYNIKSYLDDCDDGLIKGSGKTYDLRLKVPFSCLIVGKSKSGKTTLLLDILHQWRLYTTDETGQYEKKKFSGFMEQKIEKILTN